MSSVPETSPEGSYVPKGPTGRFDHSQPEIQNIPIPEGVSEFQDALAKLVKLANQETQGALGLPKHLVEVDLTHSNFDCARVEQRILAERERQAEIDKRMDRMRRVYGG